MSSAQKAETACHRSPLRLALKQLSFFCSAGNSEVTQEWLSRCRFIIPFSRISTALKRGIRAFQVLVPSSKPFRALSETCLRPAIRKLFGNCRMSRRLWSSILLRTTCGGGLGGLGGLTSSCWLKKLSSSSRSKWSWTKSSFLGTVVSSNLAQSACTSSMSSFGDS